MNKVNEFITSLDECTYQFYIKYVVVQGLQPTEVLVAVDHYTELANIQFTYEDEQEEYQYYSGESSELFTLFLEAARELISEFNFEFEELVHVHNKIGNEAKLYFHAQEHYSWIFDICIMYLPVDPENKYPLINEHGEPLK